MSYSALTKNEIYGSFDAFDVAGVRIDNVTTQETLDAVRTFVRGDKFMRITTPNVDLIMAAQTNAPFRKAVNTSALSVPDGQWLLRGARIINVKFREAVAGRLLVEPMAEIAAQEGASIFIIASQGDVAQRAAENLQKKITGLRVMGALSPSMRFGRDEEETERLLSMLDETKPDILFLGVGSPKSELWLYANAARIPSKVGISVGYAFDIIAGAKQECPRWLTKIGFEWAYRLTIEPKRLWKRYLVRDPQFFWLMLKQRLGFGPRHTA